MQHDFQLYDCVSNAVCVPGGIYMEFIMAAGIVFGTDNSMFGVDLYCMQH